MESDYKLQQLEPTESVETRVYNQIRQAIIQGQLRPGERLVLDRLASSLGVSRVPVTHSLKRLETQGFVKTVRRGETVVVEFSAADAWELYVLRIRLQPLAARYAAQHIRPEQFAEIEKLAERVAPLSGAERFRIDRQFHEAIAQASAMPRLAQICANFWEFTEVYRAILESRGQDLKLKNTDYENSSREHAALLAALRQGNGKTAEAVERAHLVRTMKLIFATLGPAFPIDESEINQLG